MSAPNVSFPGSANLISASVERVWEMNWDLSAIRTNTHAMLGFNVDRLWMKTRESTTDSANFYSRLEQNVKLQIQMVQLENINAHLVISAVKS